MSGGHRMLVWGASGHALVVADAIRRQGKYEIAGFVDTVSPERADTPFAKGRILGGLEVLSRCRDEGVSHLFIAIGDCDVRLRLAEQAASFGYELGIVVHPSAIVAEDVHIGAGTFIAAGVVVNPGTTVGEQVILNTGCSVDHDCRLADGVHVGPGAVVAGHVTLGRATLLGAGSVVKDHLSIGAGAVIGAGGVVINDIGSHVIAIGVPARPRERES